VAALADRLDLDLSRRIGDLSKGNKQKVGLVLAFSPRAQLLVLDEPTSGLESSPSGLAGPVMLLS